MIDAKPCKGAIKSLYKFKFVMTQSLAKKYIHIIFSTKQRQPLIAIRFENEIHRYLAGICDRLDAAPSGLARNLYTIRRPEVLLY